MTIFSRAIAKLNAISDKKDSNLPWSIAAEDSSEIAFSDTTYFQKASGKKELEVLYRNCWAIFKAINVRANLLASRGLKIVCKSDKAKEVVNTMLKRMHPTRPTLALQNSFKNRSINADIWGWAPDELLYDPKGTIESPADPETAKALNGFRPIHPINIDFQRNEDGKILFENGVPIGWDYKQDPSNDLRSIKLPFKRVVFLKYNQIGDEILGMSTIEPIFKTAERLMKIEEGITQGILTHGNPLHDVIVGDEAHPPTKKMIDNTAEEVKGLNLKSEYVHPPWIRVGQIESFSLGKSPNYMQPFITAIAAATQVPEFVLLGRGEGTNKATAQAMMNFIHQTIEPLQQAQALYFEEEILAPLMKLNGVDEIPMIEWNEILPNTPIELADAIKTMSETILDEKVIISYEEARELLGLGKDISFKKPVGSELAEKQSLDGINFKAPVGELISKGETKMIVLSEKFPKVQTPIYLMSENKIFGIIKLREHEEINLQKFDDLKKEHKLSEDYREANFPHKEKLFGYRFNVLKMFKEPIDYKLSQEAEAFIQDVKI